MNYEELNALLNQVNELNNIGNYDQAEQLATTVLAELEHASDAGEDQTVTERKTLHCAALLALANIARKRGDFDIALEQAHRALALSDEYNLNDIKANAWNTIGIIYDELGYYDKALEYLHKALAAYEELGEKSGVARVTVNIGTMYVSLSSYDKALEFYNNALATHQELGEKSSVALVTGNIGIVYGSLGSLDQALEYFHKALAAHEELGEKSGVARVTGNIAVVYSSLGAYNKALEYYNSALASHQELGEKSSVAHITGNIGGVYFSLGSYDKVMEYYNRALALHQELGELSAVARVTGNIGSVYNTLGSYDKALEYINRALASHQELGEKSSVASVTGNIGIAYGDKKYEVYNPVKAEEFLLKAIALSTEIGAKLLLIKQYKSLADLYENEERWKDFAIQFKKYIELKDEVNVEEVKKQEAIREQLKDIELAKATAAAKLSATTTLLHRVLPESIATRMIAGEEEIADYFPSVSILFADIAGFTPIAAGMPAAMVVRFLNYVFGRFDTIMKKHGCEKIKTIGDGYMAVAGAPVECADHAERMALAALEMQQDIQLPEEFKEYMPVGVDFGIRIGLHTGSVVGGVIGDERFVYDIYSDSVNTAARMESHGEADKIHVSEEFMHALSLSSFQSFQSFKFIERGEMDIKGKGIMKTYFLEKS